MELLLHGLPGLSLTLMGLCRRCLHLLEILFCFLESLDEHLLLWSQILWSLLEKLCYLLGPCRLNCLFLNQLRVEVILACASYKSLHVLLNKWSVDNINNSRTSLLVFIEEHFTDLLEFITIITLDWFLLILNNLEDETQQILSVKCMFQRAQLVQYTSQSPYI